MMQQAIRSVAIVGGGVAGSMVAAALAHALGRAATITVIDAGSKPATASMTSALSTLHRFHAALEIDHDDFLRATGATNALGTTFFDWGSKGSCYLRADGRTRGVQFDTRHYIAYLRRYGQARGVRHATGPVQSCVRNSNGRIDAVRLGSGMLLTADLFIDCSGAAAVLIGKTLKVDFEDWRHYLACDRAWESVCETGTEPGTHVRARAAGWEWRIGVQGRTSYGHVFASSFMSDDEAAADLPRGAAPILRCFVNGRRTEQWRHNVVAIGASASFLEPLEGSGLHLVQTGIARLLAFFPDMAFPAIDITEFNRQGAAETEQIRDFLILHYHATQRTDTPFWQACQGMEVPERLIDTMELFRSRGRIARSDNALFDDHAWRQVMLGQGMRPEAAAPTIGARTQPAPLSLRHS